MLYVAGVGAMLGLTACVIASLMTVARMSYSMAQDGLLFRWSAGISQRLSVPLLATCISGSVVGIFSVFLDLELLIHMLSIGTLLAYTIVSVGVLMLHYQRDPVGLTVADVHLDLDALEQNSEASGSATSILHHQMSTEGTGLLKGVGKVKVIRYSPETKVIKRVSSIHPPEDDDDDDDETDDEGRRPTASTSTGQAQPPETSSQKGAASQADILKTAETKNEEEIVKRMALYMADKDTPPGSTYQKIGSNYSLSSVAGLFNLGDTWSAEPTLQTRKLAIIALAVIIAIWSAICVLVVYGSYYLKFLSWWAILIVCIFSLFVIVAFVVLARQPRNEIRLNFRTPFVPFIPVASVMLNIALLVTLPGAAWIRCTIWIGVGRLHKE